MAGNGTAILNAVNEKELVDLERSAVTCNDVRPFSGPTPETFIDAQLTAMAITRFALAVVTHEPDSGCEFWPVTPPERFLGPWNATLNNPILIISNTVRLLAWLRIPPVLYEDADCHASTARPGDVARKRKERAQQDG